MKSSAKFIALAFSVVLAAAVCPAAAFAAETLKADTIASELQVATDSSLDTQASDGVTVYVISGQTEKRSDGSLIEKKKYKYNDKGLVSKCVTTNMSGSISSTKTWAYDDRGNLASAKKQSPRSQIRLMEWTFKTNKAGLVSKSTILLPEREALEVDSYEIKSNLVKSGIATSYYKVDGHWQKSFSLKTTYGYKGGRMVSLSRDNYKIKYAYDRKGNTAKITTNSYDRMKVEKMKNSYNSKTGRLVKKTTTSESDYGQSDGYTTKYAYKAIKVSASMASRVEAQQWAIINNSQNFALGSVDQQ